MSLANKLILGMRIHPTTDCWEWQGRIGANGYPRLWDGIRDVTTMARRVSWYLWVSEELPACVFTTCGNKLCVNPAHLTEEQNR